MKGLTPICWLVLLAVGIEAKNYRPRSCRLPVGSIEPCMKWYFDTTLDRCKHVPINTCAKRGNAFYKTDCQNICGKYRVDKPDRPKICSHEQKLYPCRRKYYDVIENKCKVIPWQQNECLTMGNAWVRTEQECNEKCIRPPHCFVQPDVRPCVRYYAVVENGVFVSCKKFDKDMCSDGSSNNAFTSKAECQADCKVAEPASKCSETPKSSLCKNRFYEPDQCMSYQGMCAFGDNAFETKDGCQVCIMGIKEDD